MEEHLATGCLECLGWVNVLHKVTVAATVRGQRVPESLAGEARAIFVKRHPEPLPALSRLAARLAYDSLRDPLPAGVRSTNLTRRQALYEAGDYCLDLRLETDPNERDFTLIGQIANRKTPGEQMAGIPVFLVSGDDVLLSARSTEFGEFHIEYSYERNLRLCVPIQMQVPGCLIEVSLGRFLSGGIGHGKTRGGAG